MIAYEIDLQRVAVAHEDDTEGERCTELIDRMLERPDTSAGMGVRTPVGVQKPRQCRVDSGPILAGELTCGGEKLFCEEYFHG